MTNMEEYYRKRIIEIDDQIKALTDHRIFLEEHLIWLQKHEAKVSDAEPEEKP